jgi:hypothetical protein
MLKIWQSVSLSTRLNRCVDRFHRLDAVPMGPLVNERAAMAQRRSWFVDLLYSRTVALIHETGIKRKSCMCDFVSKHVMCV